MWIKGLAILFGTAILFGPVTANAGATLDAIRARGTLRCGVATDSPGFSAPDSSGILRGFDADFCRATAAAVLGDGSKVTFVSTTTLTRFQAVQSGDVDVLFRGSTQLFARDTQLGLIFGPIYFFDTQAAMVPKKLGVKSVKELSGATICILPGSNTEFNIADYFRVNKLEYKPISIDSSDALRRSFFSGRCDVFTGDRTNLAAARSTVLNPDDYVILPETLAKSPLAPVVRQGDDQWLNIVKWIVYMTFLAEEKDLTKDNVDAALKTTNDPEVMRMLGKIVGLSKQLDLADDWALKVIKQIGNYSELYEGTFGPNTPMKVDRDANKLWSKGGLIYAPPFL
jgi:general L-amino acid transport system substrate-binding protein